MDNLTEVRSIIDNNSKLVKQAEALERLERSGDFRLIFTEGLFKDAAISNVLSRHSATEEQKRLLDIQADSIAYLRNHLMMIHERGKAAQYTIKEGLKLLDELDEE